MEIRRYLSIIRRRLLLIIVIVFAGLLGGFLITARVDTYTAKSTLYVGSRVISIEPTSGQVSSDRYAGLDRLIATFNNLIKTDPVIEDGIDRADVDRTLDEVLAATVPLQVPATNLLEISVTDRDPGVAEQLANGIAAAFVQAMREYEPPQTVEGLNDELVSVVEPATVPEVKNGSAIYRNLALGGILGLLVAGVVVALLEHLDISLRSAEDVERRLELSVLGVVPAVGDELPVVRSSVARRPAILPGTRPRGVGAG
jgi:polysaccharide biosynthesis transport protein